MVADVQPRPRGLLIVSAVFALFTLYAALWSDDLMLRYRELFAGFGTPIPRITEFVLKWPNFWWIIAIPAVAVFAWVAWHRQVTRTEKSRMKLAVAAVIVFGAAVYGFVAYAVYSGIMQMRDTV